MPGGFVVVALEAGVPPSTVTSTPSRRPTVPGGASCARAEIEQSDTTHRRSIGANIEVNIDVNIGRLRRAHGPTPPPLRTNWTRGTIETCQRFAYTIPQ